jgi:hypothetical protein
MTPASRLTIFRSSQNLFPQDTTEGLRKRAFFIQAIDILNLTNPHRKIPGNATIGLWMINQAFFPLDMI